MRWLVVAIALAACSDTSAPAPQPVAPPPVGSAAVPRPLGPVPVDPGNNMHLDDDVVRHPAPTGPARASHPIDITLRSTPSQAQAFVDGLLVGTTPTYWAGTADGREHEFTFTLAGYEIARYRFVPITSGVIHGRLTPLSEDVDGGVPEVPQVAPPPQDAAAPFVPAPPPTVITPDAAVAPTPPVGPQP
jgi:hypothetical protein